MSIAALAWAMEQGRRLKLPVAERMLLIALADRHNGGTGLCCPGQERLAADTGLSSRHIRDLAQSLDERGLISVKKVGRTCHYKLVRPNGADPEPMKQPKPEARSGIEQDDSPKYRNPVPLSDPIPEAPSAIIPEPSSDDEGDTGNPWNQYRNPASKTPEPSSTKPSKEPRKRTKEGAPSVLALARATPRRRLPEGWEPSPASISLGLDHGLTQHDIHAEADKMRDWANHRAEIGANWDARFNNWLRKEATDRSRYRQRIEKPTLQQEWNLPSFLTPHFADDDEPPMRPSVLLS